MRRFFNVQVIANAPTGGLGDKLQAVANFYASVCDLQFNALASSYSNIPFADVAGQSPLRQVEQGFYNREISLRYPGADIVIFILAPGDRGQNITPAGIMTFNDPHAYEITLFGTFGEKDHTYQNGKDLGDATTLFLCHELSHVFYSMLGKRDDTHLHFITEARPEAVLVDFEDLNAVAVQISYLQQFIAFLQAYLARLRGQQKPPVVVIDHETVRAPVAPLPPKYLWNTKENIRHSIRVIGDELGMTVLQKDLACDICQCESGFVLMARLENSPKSIDRGLFQINSYYHPEATDALAYNPEWSTRWACKAIKNGQAHALWSASQTCWNKTRKYDAII